MYLEAWDIVEARELFNVSSLGVETCSMPRAADTSITKVTIDQRSSVVGTLVTNSCKLSVLTDQQSLGISDIHLFHSVRKPSMK